MTTRPGIRSYFLTVATQVAARGDCERDQVGCVITDSSRRIVSTGYNGWPVGQPGCLGPAGKCPRGALIRSGAPESAVALLDCGTAHAEANAVSYLRDLPAEDFPLSAYVTRRPCPSCHDKLTRAGATKIYYPDQEG